MNELFDDPALDPTPARESAPPVTPKAESATEADQKPVKRQPPVGVVVYPRMQQVQQGKDARLMSMKDHEQTVCHDGVRRAVGAKPVEE